MSFRSHRRVRTGLPRAVSFGSRADIVCTEIEAPDWTLPPLTMACLSDLHAMRPWTPLEALERHVEEVNRIAPDVVFLLGDYIAAGSTPGRGLEPREIAGALAGLGAPLGVHAILGNHDWIDDPAAKATRGRTSAIAEALAAAGLDPLVNAARRLLHGDGAWVAGLDSQKAPILGDAATEARHDAEAAFAEVPEGAPAILLAHEPDYFAAGDRRAVLQLSGHTHGGQMNLFGWRPLTPSEHGARYAYGHIEEAGRHLVVSGGLGYTRVPMRIGQPPEITLVRLSGRG